MLIFPTSRTNPLLFYTPNPLGHVQSNARLKSKVLRIFFPFPVSVLIFHQCFHTTLPSPQPKPIQESMNPNPTHIRSLWGAPEKKKKSKNPACQSQHSHFIYYLNTFIIETNSNQRALCFQQSISAPHTLH